MSASASPIPSPKEVAFKLSQAIAAPLIEGGDGSSRGGGREGGSGGEDGGGAHHAASPRSPHAPPVEHSAGEKATAEGEAAAVCDTAAAEPSFDVAIADVRCGPLRVRCDVRTHPFQASSAVTFVTSVTSVTQLQA